MMRAALAAIMVFAAPAAHAACPQALSVYTEPGSGATLEFVSGSDMVMASNVFRLVVPDGPVLTGHVIWGNGVSRADGALMHECPEGDVTGDELDDCTKWQGVLYAVGSEGAVDMIGTESAAQTLLMPDLSRTLFYSGLNDGTAKLPQFDAFKLSGCQE